MIRDTGQSESADRRRALSKAKGEGVDDALKQKHQRAGKGGDQWAGYGDMASFYRVRATKKACPYS